VRGDALMHSGTSGLSDYLAADERDAIRIGRGIVARINWRKLGPRPSGTAVPPRYDPGEILDIVPADVKLPFDPREVLARILDGSRFDEYKPGYDAESHAFAVTARLYDDGIIDPRDTRTVLGLALSAVHSNVAAGRGGFGVVRPAAPSPRCRSRRAVGQVIATIEASLPQAPQEDGEVNGRAR
jgi:acetyl-CoA carboxylase carboxyltransferase component